MPWYDFDDELDYEVCPDEPPRPLERGDRVRVLLPALGDLKTRTATVIGPSQLRGYLIRLDQDGSSALLSRTCLDPLPLITRWNRILDDDFI